MTGCEYSWYSISEYKFIIEDTRVKDDCDEPEPHDHERHLAEMKKECGVRMIGMKYLLTDQVKWNEFYFTPLYQSENSRKIRGTKLSASSLMSDF